MSWLLLSGNPAFCLSHGGVTSSRPHAAAKNLNACVTGYIGGPFGDLNSKIALGAHFPPAVPHWNRALDLLALGCRTVRHTFGHGALQTHLQRLFGVRIFSL